MSEGININVTPAAVRVGALTPTAAVNPGTQVARYVVEPYIAVEETEDGAEFTVTAQGVTTTAQVYNGSDGQNGQDGKDGRDGVTPEISTTAETLAAGASAYAHTSGTPEHPLITFGIPRGAKGDKGDTGAAGTTTYTALNDKPQINGVTLSGNKTAQDLGLAAESDIPDVPVQSVNGKTGAVSLSASDVGAMPDSYTAPVSSVNGKTGAVNLNAADVGAYAKPSGGIPASDLASAVQTSLGKADTALQSAPVTSVNSQTGDVSITAASLGAYEKPAGGIPAADLADKYAASAAANGAAYRTVSIPYGEVDSTSVNTAYTVTVPGITELRDGVCCYVRNNVVTGTTGCTINVNNLGAKPMYTSNADETRVTSAFSAATTWLMIYNEKRVSGGCWDVYYGSVNANTIGYQLRTNSTALPLATYCGRYRLLFTSADGTKYVPANADTQTSAAKTHTTSTTPIDPFGEIFYYGSTSVKQANELPAATVLWQQYVITLGYSFNSANAALTLTPNKPVYIKATPQTDGSAILDYFTQDKPTTQDGKIYIYLGVAVSATTVEMTMKHPIYYHDGTRCRIWNG